MVIFGIFFLGMFSALLISFDTQYTNADTVSGDLQGIYNISRANYSSSEKSLQQDSYNTSSFSIPSASDVDVRGTSQTALIGKNTPSTIQTFILNASTYLKLNNLLIWFLGALVILTGIVLLLRFLRPSGA